VVVSTIGTNVFCFCWSRRRFGEFALKGFDLAVDGVLMVSLPLLLYLLTQMFQILFVRLVYVASAIQADFRELLNVAAAMSAPCHGFSPIT
jgi:hypothetical protein